MAIIAKAANASHAIPTNALSPNTSPLRPTNCSVDRFVKSKDPATTGQASALPPVKYSSVALSDFFILETMKNVKNATAPVVITNEIKDMVFILFPSFNYQCLFLIGHLIHFFY